MPTLIEWTDLTDNIIVVKGGGWWCRMISEGCAECYAARLNKMAFFNGNKLAYTGPAPELVLRREIMAGWARQRSARLHFVASMTDVMGDWVPIEWRIEMLDAMAAAPRQIFQILTKRADELLRTVNYWCQIRGARHLPDNIWPGVSVENQRRADERMIQLRAVAANHRWVSYEPALGPVDWRGWEFIDWMVSGGESGPSARPTHPDWHRSARDWAGPNRIAYFFKQWGEWIPVSQTIAGLTVGPSDAFPAAKSIVVQTDGRTEFAFPKGAMTCLRVGKRTAGSLLDGRVHKDFPQCFDNQDHYHAAISKRALVGVPF